MSAFRAKTTTLAICFCLAAWLQAQGTARKAPPPAMPVRTAGVVTLPDGLAYKIVRPGHGSLHPQLSDSITANYSLWLANGKFLQSTCVAGKCKPLTFPLNKLIPGWKEMIPLMTAGEKVQLWLPTALAYGDPPRKPHRPVGPLVFEIELLSIAPPPSQRPSNPTSRR